MNINEPYKASFTREQFLFHEMRVIAGLMLNDFSDDEIIDQVYESNLF